MPDSGIHTVICKFEIENILLKNHIPHKSGNMLEKSLRFHCTSYRISINCFAACEIGRDSLYATTILRFGSCSSSFKI